VAEGRFRPDLFRRLSPARLDVPPLADRPEDIPTLVVRLMLDVSPDATARPFTEAALGLLAALPWPGNLAELRDVVHRLAALPAGPVKVEDVLAQIRVAGPRPAPELGSLREARRRFEREYVAAVLMRHGWRMSEAARTLGIQRTNLYRKARQLGIPCQRRAE
jgi:two-component system nitrogen regulation response regulator NtrX